MAVLDSFKEEFHHIKSDTLSMQEYLDLCLEDPMAYASPAERMIDAIGEPEVIDTKDDPRLSKIFQNAVIRRYPAFSDFYGMEEPLERVVSYFRHAAQGIRYAYHVAALRTGEFGQGGAPS